LVRMNLNVENLNINKSDVMFIGTSAQLCAAKNVASVVVAGASQYLQYLWCPPKLLQLNFMWSTNVYSIEAATRSKFIRSSRSPGAETIIRWATATYSSLAARPTVYTSWLHIPDIKDTS